MKENGAHRTLTSELLPFYSRYAHLAQMVEQSRIMSCCQHEKMNNLHKIRVFFFHVNVQLVDLLLWLIILVNIEMVKLLSFFLQQTLYFSASFPVLQGIM
jgi:hypothetical protein